MTITTMSIIKEAERLIFEETQKRVPQSHIFSMVQQAQNCICVLKPDINATNDKTQLSVGTLQSLPADANLLLKITHNLGAAGTTPGKTIKQIDITELDAFDDEWRTSVPSAEIQHYVYDPEDPQHFEVYPPALETYVQAVWASFPTALTDMTGNISVADRYARPLIYATCELMLAGNEKQIKYQNLTASLLGVQTQNEIPVKQR